MRAYLDYAGFGRLREPARLAMQSALTEVLPDGSAEVGRLFPARRAGRASAATLLDCAVGEVGFVPNTSTGIHLVADGLDWRPGDEVVVFDGDFPANVRPWLALRRRDVRPVWVPMRGGGYLLADVAAAIGPATRVVAVSHVNFATGFRIDLDAVCELAHGVGALVCVDAVQSLGALPLSMRQTPVDFLAAGAQKWLCGPAGSGIFFCRESNLPLLDEVPCGWFGFEGAADMLKFGSGHLRYDLPVLPTAARVEGGMYDLLGAVGLAAALAELVEVGIEVVAARIRLLTERLRGGLVALGYSLAAAADDDSWSGIVSFVHAGRSSARIVDDLVELGVHVSHPDGKVRVAPHYWTSDDEVSEFLNAV